MATSQTGVQGQRVPCEVRMLEPMIITEAKWREMTSNKKKPLKKCDCAYWTYMLVGTGIFYVLSLIPLAISLFIPDYDLGSEFYEYWSYRGDTFYTTYLPLGVAFYYWVMLLIGFVFVNLVNLQNERKNPFLDSHYEYTSFIQTALMYGPALYFVTSFTELRGPHDLSSWCSKDKTHGYQAVGNVPQPMQSTTDAMIGFAEAVLALDFTSLKSAANYGGECYIYSKTEVALYNYFVWTTGFFVGLQFTHVDQGIMHEFVLDPSIMKNWPAILWVIFFALVALLVSLEVMLWYEYIVFGLEWLQLLWIALVAIYFGLRCINATNIHVHHYCIGMFLSSTIVYQSPFLTFIQAIFLGIMIEGASRWGYDPVWTYNDQPETARIQSIKQAQQIRMARDRGDNQPVPAGYLVKNVVEEADQA